MATSLSPERWERAKGLFHELLETDPADRPALLDSSCGGDGQLRSEVERLLAHHASASGFLEPPVRGAAGNLDALLAWQPTVFSAGQMVNDRFRIVRFIGKGGMGEVYEAEDCLANVRVALKTLRSGMETSGMHARFLRELQLARKVTHPNVCRIHDVFEYRTGDPILGASQSVVFLSMELLDGGNLAERIAHSGQLSEREAMPIVRGIAAALEAAHDHGVIHGDLKSSNVMIIRAADGSDRAVLTDFGLARASSGESPAEYDWIAGTPDYMAPEQLTRGETGFAADIFALGVVIYEMRTGRRPFGNSSTISGAARRVNRQPDSPTLYAPQLEPRWERAILGCLALEPTKRYVHPSQVVRILEGTPDRRRLTRRAAIGAVASAVGGLWLWKPWLPKQPKLRVSSMAVLAFQTSSPDREISELAGGLAEELMRMLAGIKGLKVVRNPPGEARDSRSLREIGRRLNVDAILSGSLRRDSGRVTVTAQLTNLADGQWLWSGSFDETDAYLTRLRMNLCVAIAGAVAPRLSGPQLASLGAAEDVSGEAYNLYLRARYHSSYRLEDGLKKSIDYLNQSIAADPSYAPAHALLSDAYNILAGRRGCPQQAYFEASENAANRALQLDSRLAEAHVAKGLIEQRFRWNWEAAESHFQEAIRLNPGLATAHHRYAGFSSNLGYHSIALAEIQRAVELDPYWPTIQTTHGVLLYRARRYDEALTQFEKARSMFQSYALARSETADCLGAKGHWEEAVQMYRTAAEMGGGEPAGLAHALGRAGHIEEARQKAAELERAFPVDYPSAVGVATAYRGIGDWDKVFHWLDLALERREPGLLIVKVDPANDPIRTDPRFSKLLERLRL